MNRTLLDITEDLQALDDLLTEAGGDIAGIEATVDAWLAELEQDLKGKVDNYAALITAMNARAEVRKAEADRLYRRAKVDAGNARFLRERLKFALEQRGISKLETDRYKVGVSRVIGKEILDEQTEATEWFLGEQWADRSGGDLPPPATAPNSRPEPQGPPDDSSSDRPTRQEHR